ncbi:MAG: MFS transporter [Myxococcota bacterium]|nr:MFS transporter [Myxococcota bacterium]
MSAPNTTPKPPSSNKPKLVIFLTVLMDLVGFGIVIPLLPFYAQDVRFQATPMEIGLLMASYSLAQFFFAPVWGTLSDRFGRRPILLTSIGMGALMLAGFALSQSLLHLFVFRTLHGVFAANISTAQAYMADISAPEDRAKAMGMIGAAFGLWFTLGPWIGGELSVRGLAAPIWLASGLGTLNFVLAGLFLPESRDPNQPSSRHPRSISPLTFLRVLRHPIVGSSIGLIFLMTFSFSMMECTFALFEQALYGLDAQDVGRLMGLIGVVMIVVQGGLIGPLSKRFGEAFLVRIGLPGLGIGLLALVYAPPTVPLAIACIILATFHGLSQPSLFAIISKRTPASDQGLVMGTNQSLSALARATAPAIGLAVFTGIAHSATFLLAALLMGAASIVAWFIIKPTEPVEAVQTAPAQP